MSSPLSLEDVGSHPLPLSPQSRPNTAVSDTDLIGFSSSLNCPETLRAAVSSTARLPRKHVRSQTEGQDAHRNIGKFSKLLGTVLGSTIANASSSSIAAQSDRTLMAATPRRSNSPSPSLDFTFVSVPSVPSTPHRHSMPPDVRTATLENIATCASRSMFFPSPSKKTSDSGPTLAKTPSPSKPGGKRILPRFWTALSSPSKEPAIRFKCRGREKEADCGPFSDYPLDGEEGELIDEACFVDIPVPICVDILSRLPPEIALHILLFLDLSTIILCFGVSQHWHRLASDPLVWRTLFHANPGWELNNELVQRRLAAATPSTTFLRRNSSIVSVATSSRNERVRRVHTPPPPSTPSHNQSQYSHVASSSRPGTPLRQSISSTATTAEMALSSPSRLGCSIPEGALAPLTLDWQALYKMRYEIERRMYGIPPSVPSVADAEAPVGLEPRVMKLAGHMDSVYCLEFDAYKIVTGSRDRTIKVWSLRTGELKRTLAGHEGSVLCLKFDASGFMISGSSDRRILVWDLVRGEVRKVLTGHQGGVLDLRVDRQWIVSCSKDAVIRVWDRATLQPHCSLFGHDGPVNAVGLQNGKIVSASGDGRMMLWDIATSRRIRTFDGHDRGLACIEFKDDYICSGSNDWKIKVWSASTGVCLRVLTGHSALVRALSFNPRTGRLVSGSYDRSVKMWDIHTGTMIREFRNIHHSHIFDVKFDASHIVSTSHDQRIVVLDWSYGLDATWFL